MSNKAKYPKITINRIKLNYNKFEADNIVTVNFSVQDHTLLGYETYTRTKYFKEKELVSKVKESINGLRGHFVLSKAHAENNEIAIVDTTTGMPYKPLTLTFLL